MRYSASAKYEILQRVDQSSLPSAPDAHIHRSTYYNWLKRYDDGGVDALAETIIGLYKTAAIRTRGPWKTLDDVEYATLEWGPTGSTITVCWRPSATCHRLSMKRCTMLGFNRSCKAAWLKLNGSPEFTGRFNNPLCSMGRIIGDRSE